MSICGYRRFAAFATALSLLIIVGSLVVGAQEKQESVGINWEDGPTVGKLGGIAQITVPDGYRFTGKAGTQRLLELTQNPTSGTEVGAIVPDVANSKDLWIMYFDFDEIGYVKDEEKNKLNPDDLLKSIRDATEESNKIRAQKGWSAFHVVGWELKPFYDAQTHDLTWAIRGRGEGSEEETVNYSTRVLGRRGTMNIDLVLSPNQVSQVIPSFVKLMRGFSYQPGSRYSEFVKGDKVAKYGLTALIAGAAGAAAVKSGLLAKFWKLIVVVFVAIAGAIKRFFKSLRRLFSGGKRSEDGQASQG